VYATPLGMHPDIRPSTFAVGVGDRLVFYTNGLLEARGADGDHLAAGPVFSSRVAV
jgi:serine phosphatase RsbU (regulator of sigma subunit)